MPRKILLIEPNYKNKYPPIGLMKISTYHKMLNDKVEFYKGDLKKFITNLKFEECLKDLKRIDRNTIWINKSDVIKSYLSTRHSKYLLLITNNVATKNIQPVIETLSKHARQIPKNKWDKIYIGTLFTFYWAITTETIHFAKTLVDDYSKIFVGGVMATLLQNEILEETGILSHAGLLDKPGALDEGNQLIIDELPLDYSILDEIDYVYPTQSAYFTFMTKGCTRKCAFCSVPKLEPVYKNKIESKDKFRIVNENFGEQRNLLLMDNNVLASPKFPEIIQEIIDMGFFKGAKFEQPNLLDLSIQNLKYGVNKKANVRKSFFLLHSVKNHIKGDDLIIYTAILSKYNLNNIETATRSNLHKAHDYLKELYERYRVKGKVERYVDFNQGTDARYVTEENMQLMSLIPIRPLRIAFDHIGIKSTYIKAVELAAKYGINNLSNYILYNFHDKPEDFYERLKINVDLGKRLNIKIFSFPMKYIPLFGEEAKHRKYIGPHWNRKFIRAVQSILNATKGIVAPGYEFFYMAFGKNLEKFLELLWMPENYIINRLYFERNGMTQQWQEDFNSLDELEKIQAKQIITENNFADLGTNNVSNTILRLLSHYVPLKGEKDIVSKEVKKLRNKYNKLIQSDTFINLTLTHDFDQTKKTKLNLQ